MWYRRIEPAIYIPERQREITMEVIFIGCLMCLPMIMISMNSRTSKKLPPGPKPLPLIGNLLDLGDQPHKSLAKLSERYGPIMSLRLGQVTAIVVSSSTAAKEILQHNDQFFANRPTPDAARACRHSEFGMPWVPASTLWRNLRKISNSHLFSGKKLKHT